VNVIQEFETRMLPDLVPGFRQLVGQARVSDPILLNQRAMVRMIAPVQWILRRVGSDGIRLTKAGHLPPAVVVEASSELDWGWPINVNREVRIRPLWELRVHLRDIGLLRVSKGTLLLTARGRTLVESPRELWRYLAATIARSRTPAVSDATRLLLLYVATRTVEHRGEYLEGIGRGLTSLGWAFTAEYTSSDVAAEEIIAAKWRVLTRLGVFEESGYGFGRTETVTVGGAAFARAALKVEVPATAGS
jgi:hypothetical protein